MAQTIAPPNALDAPEIRSGAAEASTAWHRIQLHATHAAIAFGALEPDGDRDAAVTCLAAAWVAYRMRATLRCVRRGTRLRYEYVPFATSRERSLTDRPGARGGALIDVLLRFATQSLSGASALSSWRTCLDRTAGSQVDDRIPVWGADRQWKGAGSMAR